jgi:hypothetical protein
MNTLLIPVLILTSAIAIVLFFRAIGYFGSNKSQLPAAPTAVRPVAQPRSDVLNCHAELVSEQQANWLVDAFRVEICGTIHTAVPCNAFADVRITDITDGADHAKAVYAPAGEKWSFEISDVFRCRVELGKLPANGITLPDWLTIASIPPKQILLPKSGCRNLEFETSIISCENGELLACASWSLIYNNTATGYIEVQEAVRRAKITASALAFAVAAVGGKMSASALRIVRDWTKDNIDISKASNRIRCVFDKLIAFIAARRPDCTGMYISRLCKKMIESVPLKIRYDIMNLCLHVAAESAPSPQRVALLKDIAAAIRIEREKFREMAEKVLRLGMYEVQDAEINLGITADMNKTEILSQLTREYRKWNARITNRDPQIKSQAEHMLQLIAQTRDQYAR